MDIVLVFTRVESLFEAFSSKMAYSICSLIILHMASVVENGFYVSPSSSLGVPVTARVMSDEHLWMIGPGKHLLLWQDGDMESAGAHVKLLWDGGGIFCSNKEVV